MGQYAILDTGYANKTNTGTQETMANSGTAITFDSFSLDLNVSNNNSTQANPGRYEAAETNYVSFGNAGFVLQGLVDRTSADYETLVTNCNALRKTKGLKLLYYNSSTDGYKSMVNSLGTATHGSLQVDGTIKSVLCRVGSFTIKEDPKSKLARFTLVITETNPLE
jgi:hypothetical protein